MLLLTVEAPATPEASVSLMPGRKTVCAAIVFRDNAGTFLNAHVLIFATLMHEMSLAVNIVDLAVEAALREGGSRVSEIEIEIGNMAGVMIDSLDFCLEAAARSTIVEGAEFKFIPVNAFGECPSCQKKFETDSYFASCPDCGATGVPVTGGQDLRINSLVIEE